MDKDIFVKKLDGSLQKYDESKLKMSLSNSGADEETISRIMSKVDSIVYNGIETKRLFKFALNEFKKYQPYIALKYDLKNAVLRLGGEGFIFERFVSIILKKQGYAIKLNQIVKGRCITHEIDISAEKNNERMMVECKHHAKPWMGCDIHTALYVYARYLDVKKAFTVPMLATNTKFSTQVLAYSKGVGLKLMGWKMPKGNSLEYNIEKFRLYPITMLSSLAKEKASALLNSNILLITDLLTKNADIIANTLKIGTLKANKILDDAKELCEHC